MDYQTWEQQVPDQLKSDGVWRFFAYRKALYLYDLAWDDCDGLMKDPRGVEVMRQLIRSAGSISANIEEGHGRGLGRDRNHFLRISLGSAREARGWYYRSRRLLQPQVLSHRLMLLSEIVALLVAELQKQQIRYRKQAR